MQVSRPVDVNRAFTHKHRPRRMNLRKERVKPASTFLRDAIPHRGGSLQFDTAPFQFPEERLQNRDGSGEGPYPFA